MALAPTTRPGGMLVSSVFLEASYMRNDMLEFKIEVEG